MPVAPCKSTWGWVWPDRQGAPLCTHMTSCKSIFVRLYFNVARPSLLGFTSGCTYALQTTIFMKQKCVFVRKDWRDKGTTTSNCTTNCTFVCTTATTCVLPVGTPCPPSSFDCCLLPPAVFLAPALQLVFHLALKTLLAHSAVCQHNLWASSPSNHFGISPCEQVLSAPPVLG